MTQFVATLLDRINSPADLRGLGLENLKALAEEIRHVIIETCLQNGGHIGASLGTVELALALHSVLNSPVDKIVWDVGHQAYTHKLITGRRQQFHTLRQLGGLSGFLRREESPHDAFGAGHASTSVSAALGYAKARDLSNQDHVVVAVIGDGALTGGMAFEALNNAGHAGTDLIVFLNDNEMSIARNVGALPQYLSRLRMDSTLGRMRDEVEQVVRKLPGIGSTAGKLADALKDSFKHLFMPGRLFEEMGFTYFGPLDGHNVPLLQKAVRDAIARGGPVLIHALTDKGRGYEPAADHPEKFHSTAPSAKPGTKKPPSYSTFLADTLIRLAKEDPRIVAITAAMPSGTGLDRFAAAIPERFFDVGIAEQHAVTFAAGLACGGMRPFAVIYSTFLQRAMDQIIHDVALQNLPVTFCLDRAGLVGDDGPTHHGVFDLAYLRMVPNMVIMAPKDENELQHMLKTALVHDGPAAIRFPRGQVSGVKVDDNLQRIPLGRAERLRSGSDVTIIAVGPMVERAVEASDRLAKTGVTVGVINARFIKPLDEGLILEAAVETGCLVTVEDGVLAGGFGSAVAEVLAKHDLAGGRLKMLGIGDTFVEHGPVEVLRAEFGLTTEGIVAAVSALLAEQPVQLPSVLAGGE